MLVMPCLDRGLLVALQFDVLAPRDQRLTTGLHGVRRMARSCLADVFASMKHDSKQSMCTSSSHLEDLGNVP